MLLIFYRLYLLFYFMYYLNEKTRPQTRLLRFYDKLNKKIGGVFLNAAAFCLFFIKSAAVLSEIGPITVRT